VPAGHKLVPPGGPEILGFTPFSFAFKKMMEAEPAFETS